MYTGAQLRTFHHFIRGAENRTRTLCSQSIYTTTILRPDRRNDPKAIYYHYATFGSEGEKMLAIFYPERTKCMFHTPRKQQSAHPERFVIV